MQPQIERYQHPEKHGHGGHGGHDEHSGHGEQGAGDEEGGSDEGGESGDEKSEDEGEGGDGDESKSDDSSNEGAEKDTPDTSDDEGLEDTTHEKEGGQNVEGVQFKGASSGTKDGEQGDTRKHIPDAKGFSKKRIESNYGGKEGEAQNPEQDPSDKDMVSVAPYVAPLKETILLTSYSRLLPPNLQEIKQHSRGSRRDFQILTPSTRPTLQTTRRRVPKVKAAPRQRKTREQWILKGHRSETLDDTFSRNLRAV